MNLTDLAADLAARVRDEGAASPAVVLGLHLTVAVWDAVDPADIDTELTWGTAAIAARAVLDTLDPLPARRIDIPTDLVPGADPGPDTAAVVAALLTAIADAFGAAATGSDRLVRLSAAWYRDAEQDLHAAATALS